MNALKVFFLILLAVVFSHTASAATVNVAPGKEVGVNTPISNVSYWAGVLVLNIDGTEMPGMSIFPIGPTSEGYITCSDCAFYTYDDVASGNPAVVLGSAEYSKGVIAFGSALSDYHAGNSKWTAVWNEIVWMAMWESLPGTNLKEFIDPSAETPMTYLDLYNSSIAPGLVSDYDWSYNNTRVLASPSHQIAPLLVDVSSSTSTQPVPIPTALLLFGSGLIGLGAIARRKNI